METIPTPDEPKGPADAEAAVPLVPSEPPGSPVTPRPSGPPESTVPSESPVPLEPRLSRILGLAVRILEPLSVATLFVYLLRTTWMRWPDPLFDFPRELYTAWRVSAGDKLYVDVLSWYGPMPHLIEGAAFKIFGAGLDTLVWLNVLVTICTLLLLRGIFGALGNRLTVWLCSVTFLVVFAFGQFVLVGNYNFMTPYASQATYGLAGCLLTLWALVRHAQSGGPRWWWIAGVGIGITYVNKPEPLLAGGVALAVYLLASFLYAVRDAAGSWPGACRWVLVTLERLVGGFFCIWLPTFAVLALKGGIAYAWRYTNWVPYTVLAGPFVKTGTSSKFNAKTFGFDVPYENFMIQLKAGGWLLLICGALLLVAWLWSRAPKYKLAWCGSLAAAAGIAAATAWRLTWLSLHPAAPPAPGVMPPWQINWLEIGRAIIFPVYLAAFALVVWSWHAAWRQRADFARVAALAAFATAAALLLLRMILNGRIFHYGFFMTPLAVFLIILLMTGEAPRRLAGQRRFNWLLPTAIAPLVLTGVVYLGIFTSRQFQAKTFAVGEGRDRFYTYDPRVFPNGFLLANMIEMVKAVKAHVPDAQTLVAFPESAAVNYHTRLRDPMPEMDFHQTIIEFVGKDEMLQDLQRHPPDIAILYYRDMSEYGAPFGAEENTGLALVNWIAQNYVVVMRPFMNTPYTVTGHVIDILLHKPLTAKLTQTPPAPPAPPSPAAASHP